jgi:two-component system, OmpR family, sensor histidine kinase KdpD
MKTVVQEHRRTPEELLREAQAADPLTNKGYLKIFLGYASGVGKSFRMLDEARRRRERGQDVVVGAIQPHVPPEAEAILRNLEVIPLKPVGQGTALDVEALINRHPDACFIDGLAYNNPPGSRNETRWQDAKELVQAGIKVIASINIQYVTELREEVEAITGKEITQTVPISFLKSADEIEIVDAPALEPLGRSLGEQTSRESRQLQLLKLREMTLVLAADVVDHQLGNYLESHGIKQHFGTQERILVCITPRTETEEMVETAQVVAERFHGELFVTYVNEADMSAVDRALLDQKLALAGAGGAHTEVLQGADPAQTILEFARARGITQLFLGHSRDSGFWLRRRGNQMNKLIQNSHGIDVRIFPIKQ